MALVWVLRDDLKNGASLHVVILMGVSEGLSACVHLTFWHCGMSVALRACLCYVFPFRWQQAVMFSALQYSTNTTGQRADTAGQLADTNRC